MTPGWTANMDAEVGMGMELGMGTLLNSVMSNKPTMNCTTPKALTVAYVTQERSTNSDTG